MYQKDLSSPDQYDEGLCVEMRLAFQALIWVMDSTRLKQRQQT